MAEKAAHPKDGYMSLRALAANYSGLSVRTLRAYLSHPTRPLPHFRVGGKILVRRSEFDAWVAQFRVSRSVVGIPTMVDEVVQGLR